LLNPREPAKVRRIWNGAVQKCTPHINCKDGLSITIAKRYDFSDKTGRGIFVTKDAANRTRKLKIKSRKSIQSRKTLFHRPGRPAKETFLKKREFYGSFSSLSPKTVKI
jgi:hypothetical protein